MKSRITLSLILSACAVAILAVVTIPLTAEETDEKNSAERQEAEWHVWSREALDQAQEADKPILALFTGSDWCAPCIQQESRVFDTEEFQQWAPENVVLLKLDYPRQKEQSEEMEEHHQNLLEHFQVRGFPTMVVLTPGGQETERFNYTGSDAEGWIERVEPMVDEALAQAEKEDDAEEEAS